MYNGGQNRQFFAGFVDWLGRQGNYMSRYIIANVIRAVKEKLMVLSECLYNGREEGVLSCKD